MKTQRRIDLANEDFTGFEHWITGLQFLGPDLQFDVLEDMVRTREAFDQAKTTSEGGSGKVRHPRSNRRNLTNHLSDRCVRVGGQSHLLH